MPLRSKAAKGLEWLSKRARSKTVSSNLSSLARAVKPTRRSRILRARRVIKLGEFFADPKKLKILRWAQRFVMAGGYAATLLTAKELGELKRRLLWAGSVAVATSLTADYGLEHATKRLLEEHCKIFGKLINNPKVGRKVVEKIRNKKIRDLVLFFSETKFIPQSEKPKIAQDFFKENRTSAVTKLTVAAQLYAFSQRNSKLTSELARTIFRYFGRGNIKKGNYPQSREILLAVLLNIPSAFISPSKELEGRNLRVRGDFKVHPADKPIKILMTRTAGKRYSVLIEPRPQDN